MCVSEDAFYSLIALLLNLLDNNSFRNSQCWWQYKTPFKNGSATRLEL